MTLKSVHGIEVEEFLDSIRKTIRSEISSIQNEGSALKNNDLKGIEIAQKITNLSRSRIYQLVCKNQIPYFKKSGKLFFSEKELINWIKTGKKSHSLERKESDE